MVALPPLQVIGVVTAAVAVTVVGSVTVTGAAMAVHPLKSFTVMALYVPAVTLNVLPAWKVMPSRLLVYGVVPRPAVTGMVALPPVQVIGVVTAAVAVTVVGSVTVTGAAMAVHPLKSFTVMALYVPAVTLNVLPAWKVMPSRL